MGCSNGRFGNFQDRRKFRAGLTSVPRIGLLIVPVFPFDHGRDVERS